MIACRATRRFKSWRCPCQEDARLSPSVQATTRFKATAIPAKKAYYRTEERPDVWFEPTEVWEIRGADLTISPVHKAAVGQLHPDRGVSLRSGRAALYWKLF